MSNSTVDATLKDRDSKYGYFPLNATTSQRIKAVMNAGKHWDALKPDQQEALEMIALKIGRILNGDPSHADPSHADAWHDIAGYARLVEREL